MRQNLHANNGTSMPGFTDMPVPPKGKRTVEISKPTRAQISLAYIIDEKPPAEEVMDYFRNKIASLEGEEDSD